MIEQNDERYAAPAARTHSRRSSSLIRRDMASCRRGLCARPRGSLTGHRVAAEENGAHVVAPRTLITGDGVVTADSELVELDWLGIEDSLKLDMPGITMAVLEELKISTAGGFTHDQPVPFYRMQRGKRLREFLE